MTKDEYKAALRALGMTQHACGAFMGHHPTTGRNWAQRGPPPPVAKFLLFMIAMEMTPEVVERFLSRKTKVEH